MDGGSTDLTLDILREYDGRVQWLSERDNGQSDALNKGFRIATGDIIAFLNSDDFYEPGALDAVGRYFVERPAAKWLTGRCRNVDQYGREIRKTITRYKNLWLKTYSYRVLMVLNFISQPATFWRREVYETVGGVDESLHYAMDYDYWLRIGQHYSLDTLDTYLANFRIHPASKAGSSAAAQFDAEIEIVKRYHPNPVEMLLHRAHTAITVSTYKRLLRREHAQLFDQDAADLKQTS